MNVPHVPAAREDAERLDKADPLRRCRNAFDLPDGVIYLDGNSLGPPPRCALDAVRQTAEEEWGRDLIGSWNNAGWFELPSTCGAKIAKLIGAAPNEVVVADSVSINIFKLTAALLKTHPGAVAVFDNEFPTDGYILQGLSSLTGVDVRVAAKDNDPFDGDISVLVASVIDYRTAEIIDISAMEKRAAANNVAIIWDLSHATGLLPLKLRRDGGRYAVGCGYKYLNGGPGAPAFLYASEDAPPLMQPLSGWMGHAAPFEFEKEYRPADGVRRFACGTPPILSLSALDAALDVLNDVHLEDVRVKSQQLGDLFLSRALSAGLETVSPKPGNPRGGHVSLRFPHGYEVVQALIARGVIGDFRSPDLMRFGFSPLFLSYVEVWNAAEALIEILRTEEWRRPEYARRSKVT